MILSTKTEQHFIGFSFALTCSYCSRNAQFRLTEILTECFDDVFVGLLQTCFGGCFCVCYVSNLKVAYYIIFLLFSLYCL